MGEGGQTEAPHPRARLSWARDNAGIMIVALAGLIARAWVSTNNSYWLDELYSVYGYGSAPTSYFAMIWSFAKSSIHPPLYQTILYFWISLLGDSEAATRLLSNLFVTGATVFLYLSVARACGKGLALAAAITFSCMYTPNFYAAEARSYALSIFLVCASSLFFVRYVMRIAARGKDCDTAHSPAVALTICNALILYTHYYNVFFILAQSALLILAAAWIGAPGERRTNMLKSIMICAVPFSPLLGWAPVMLAQYGTDAYHDTYAVAAPSLAPWEFVHQMVVAPNVSDDIAVASGFLAALLVVPALGLINAVRSRGLPAPRDILSIYAATLLVGPCMAALAAFAVSGLERLSSRYFAFCTPAIAILMVLAVDAALRALAQGFPRLKPHVAKYGFVYACVLASAVVVPRGVAAVMEPKTDWSGTAVTLLEIASREPESLFYVMETTYREFPTLNYYLERGGSSLRVGETVSRKEEDTAKFDFEPNMDRLRKHDVIAVVFTHHSATQFPRLLGHLKASFPTYQERLDRDGRGVVLFRSEGRKPQSPPDGI